MEVPTSRQTIALQNVLNILWNIRKSKWKTRLIGLKLFTANYNEKPQQSKIQ